MFMGETYRKDEKHFLKPEEWIIVTLNFSIILLVCGATSQKA
jgi:hypothetical protein